MSNLWFNIRFGKYHLQLTNKWKISFRLNSWWLNNTPGRWFEIYTLFGKDYG